jgi:mono/diheme cytochrome c family protein
MKHSLAIPISAVALAAAIGGPIVTAGPIKAAVRITAGHSAARSLQAQPFGAQSDTGKAVFERSGCQGCHKLNGKGGTTGPDLSHEGGKRDAAYIAGKLEDPKATNKDSVMPKFTGSAEDKSALVAFLASLK